MRNRETDVKRLLFQQRRGYVGVIDIRLIRAAARDSRTHVIRTCEILLIRFNYGRRSHPVQPIRKSSTRMRACEAGCGGSPPSSVIPN